MNNESIWNRDYILLLLTNTFIFIGMHMLSTTIANFALSLSGTETIAGFIAGVFSVTAILVRPICGNLIDRRNKKTLYLLSVLVIFISMIGYGISTSNVMLIISRLLHGVGWGFATTIGMTMATNTVSETKIGEASSVYGLANVLAMAVSPALGAYLSENFGYPVMFIGAAIVVVIAFICLWFVKDQPVELREQKPRLAIGSLLLKEATAPALVILLTGMAYNAVTTFLIIYAKQVGIANPSIFFTVYSFTILVVRLNAGKIVDRRGAEWVMVPAGIFFCGCLLVLANLKSAAMLYSAAVLMGFGYSANMSTMMAVTFKRTEKSQRGMASSTINIGMDFGTGVGAAVAGTIAQRIGYNKLYLVLIVPVVIATVLFVADQKMFRNKQFIYKKET